MIIVEMSSYSNMKKSSQSTDNAFMYVPLNEDVFTYIGKDKTKWHKLEATFARKFREKKISYLRTSESIRALRVVPVPAAHIPIPPGGETENQREERKRRVDREDRIYNAAHQRLIEDERKIQEDFAVAITIVQEHVSEKINTDLQAILVEAEQRNCTEEEKYNLVYNT